VFRSKIINVKLAFTAAASVFLLMVSPASPADTTPPPVNDSTILKIIFPVTLNSTQLPEELLAMFEKEYGIKAKKVTLCTGDADKYLRSEKPERIDVVIGHEQDIENKLLTDGYIVNIREILYSNFVIVGPKEDPAGIKGFTDPTEALKTITMKKALFFSRGDNSGTHGLEKKMWKLAKIEPNGECYITTNTGTDATLVIANKKRGYTISHYPTFIQQQETLDMVVMVDGNYDNQLVTSYEAMAVNPEKFPDVHYVDAMTFIGFLTSPKIQEYIANSGIDKFKRQTNFPLAVKVKPKSIK
jgi:tungstate transport system substrate-binding protein